MLWSYYTEALMRNPLSNNHQLFCGWRNLSHARAVTSTTETRNGLISLVWMGLAVPSHLSSVEFVIVNNTWVWRLQIKWFASKLKFSRISQKTELLLQWNVSAMANYSTYGICPKLSKKLGNEVVSKVNILQCSAKNPFDCGGNFNSKSLKVSIFLETIAVGLKKWNQL